MPAPACSTCNRAMKCLQVGANIAIYAKVIGVDRPYQVWSGDEYGCDSCHARVVLKYAEDAFWHHFQSSSIPRIDIKVFEHSQLTKV